MCGSSRTPGLTALRVQDTTAEHDLSRRGKYTRRGILFHRAWRAVAHGDCASQGGLCAPLDGFLKDE